MNLETEHNIFGKIKKFTEEDNEICEQKAESIYQSLLDTEIANFFSNQTDSDEWLLAIQITDSFQNSLYELSANLAKIKHAKEFLPEYYEYEAA
ncbi:hypothetical protein QE193_25605 (plasmid) [Arsenophonus nasoniae]|uniref:Uncharacterized protein n=1 Tax=Arsenophonus nasoniae TaxID=638 RepID=A0AA95H0X5_9GAMM|nr:hypothetical protein [Arsenophonus nasoniae]WGM04052.1 hypothetical protein QE210_21500 [Arsenophonus nasoniae]WGM18529.1 hypothetical protein QE193_25605 [Arsenophonus nasoniae]